MRILASSASRRSFRHSVAAAVLALAAAAASPGAVRAQTPAALYSFSGNSTDGGHPVGGLVQGTDGNFYGTTARGGSANNGTVYRLTPAGTFTLLYSFSGGNDGGEPVAALALGADGNFYGTTQFGGYYDEGTLFSITPAGVQTVLVNFGAGDDGAQPVASLVLGPDGNFYGTTEFGGTDGKGTVFQYTAGGAYSVLLNLGYSYGAQPVGPVVFAADGNLYGTTEYGGSHGYGTVFQLTTAGGVAKLLDFSGNDGARPQGGLALLPGSTTLYGTASTGGANGFGTIFEITTAGEFTKLHDFTGADGDYPQAALLLASDGNFYGTAFNGGDNHNDGTLFELTPQGVFTSLAVLDEATGINPAAPLIQGANGTLYGTAYAGGLYSDGTVFSLDISAPVVYPAFFNGQMALGNGVFFLAFPNGNPFGYYSFLADPAYIYHFDLGYEYVFDANDGVGGVYLYDFASSTFFYTSPVFPFPYLYDFTLKSVLYYYPDPAVAGHYTTGPRYFYDFGTGKIITK